MDECSLSIVTLRHGDENSTHEIGKLNCRGCRHQPRAPYLPVSVISLELIWIPGILLHMTRTAVALLRQMSERSTWQLACVLTHSPHGSRVPGVCLCAAPSSCAKVGGKKKKQLPESHLSVTCERRADEAPCRDEGNNNNEGCAFIGDVLPVACRQRKNTVERSTHRWHQWATVTVRFGKFWIFMMMSYWVAIGARTANKLSPPCLKGNALPILKTLPCFLELRLQVNDGKTTVTFAASYPPPPNLLKSPPLSIWSTA